MKDIIMLDIMTLFECFNIDMVAAGTMNVNQIKGDNVYLWKFHQIKPCRRKTRVVFYKDDIRPGITKKERGPKRVNDLEKFYRECWGDSPFLEI